MSQLDTPTARQPVLYGYARVSKQKQNLTTQIRLLNKAGCKQIFYEKISGAKDKKVELGKLISVLQKGDVVVVAHLDRLGRNLVTTLRTIEQINNKGASIKALDFNLDSGTAMGDLMIKFMAFFAELERYFAKMRSEERLANLTKKQRSSLGRKAVLDKKTIKKYYQQYLDRKTTVAAITEKLGITRASFYNALKRYNIKTYVQSHLDGDINDPSFKYGKLHFKRVRGKVQCKY
ncbi:DNA invertase [Abalone shriveling syndrome-associated virus]|uniref:DNA invertase n=1 Tax=Abalone shriveling syndrome-associated virus TaxID=491893 RepID=UPI0001881BBB|nr:DNA invertase [Abalone shriveling syndrome-associated virus]ACJ71996.1 recombinase [Abalone shriveling syndrome-associated virus]